MKKNILIAVYNMDIGGIERSLINMLESFDYDRFQVDVLVFHHTGDFMPLLPKQARLLPEVAAYTVFRKPMSQCIREGHFLATAVRLLCKGIAKFMARRRALQEGSGYIEMQLVMKYGRRFLPKVKTHYDTAISYAWPHDVIAHCVDADRKIAWIHTDYSKLEIDRALDLAVWQQFDHIAGVSDECRNTFLKVYPTLQDRVLVVENINSPDFIHKMASSKTVNEEIDEDAFRILSIGRLSYVKGFDMAVQALRILHDRGYYQMKWYVVGYGGNEAELRSLITEHRLEESFVLLGKKINPYPYIQASDLYVQPSRYEGKAVSVTEAQMLGKPVLITDYPTARSQVEPYVDGMICERSEQGIADGIERLYLDEALRARLVAEMRRKDYGNVSELDKLYDLMTERSYRGVVSL